MPEMQSQCLWGRRTTLHGETRDVLKYSQSMRVIPWASFQLLNGRS